MAQRRITHQQKRRILDAQEKKLAAFAEIEVNSNQIKGIVIANYGSYVDVLNPQTGQSLRCHQRASLPTLAAGDDVLCEPNNATGGVVLALLPRKSTLSRSDSRGKLKVIAANVDHLCIVFAPLPQPHQNLINKYLVLAEHLGFSVTLILNKADLLTHAEHHYLYDWLKLYQSLGYETIITDTLSQEGIERLNERLNAHTSVFVGQSGVGKSSLINQIIPLAEAKTMPLSIKAKGTHTTTTATWLPFTHKGCTGAIIDSPGIRDMGITHLDRNEIERGFVEFGKWATQCTFPNCTHTLITHCALLQAVAAGDVYAERVKSFQFLVNENQPTWAEKTFKKK